MDPLDFGQVDVSVHDGVAVGADGDKAADFIGYGRCEDRPPFNY
jgi:hypothetical protein